MFIYNFNYKIVIDSIKKFTPNEVETMCRTSIYPHPMYGYNITLIKYFQSSVEPEEEDPVQKQFEEMNKKFIEIKEAMKIENDALKIKMAKYEEILMKNELLPPPEKQYQTIVITEIE